MKKFLLALTSVLLAAMTLQAKSGLVIIAHGHVLESWRKPVLALEETVKARLTERILLKCVLRRGGLKIGVFGMLTDVSSVVAHDIAEKLVHLDDFSVANKWADYLKNTKKCDLVIALTHIGYSGGPVNDKTLVKNTRNIDIVVGGHSHTFLKEPEYRKNLDGKEIPIVQDGCWGLNIGQIDVFKK